MVVAFLAGALLEDFCCCDFGAGVDSGISWIGAGRRCPVISKSTIVKSGKSVRFKARIISRNNKQFARERIFDFRA